MSATTLTLQDCLRALAGLDPDRATVRNEAGFSASDGGPGHRLARRPLSEWVRADYEQARELVGRYRRQLTELLGMAPEDLAQLIAAPIPDDVPSERPSFQIAQFPRPCCACRQVIAAGDRFTRGRERGARLHYPECPAPAPVEPPISDGHVQEPEPRDEDPERPRPKYGARDILGPGGVIARTLPGYEHRESQLQLADAVQRAMQDRIHLVSEAGTGTGKSLAYLVPALNLATTYSDFRVVVSTADKALQAQIVNKDIPFLQSVYPEPFGAALLKGRSNYVCLLEVDRTTKRLEGGLEGFGDALFETPESGRAWGRLRGWIDDQLEQGGSGDLENLDWPLPPDVRDLATIDSDGCIGKQCPFLDRCFVERAKADARAAHIVVVNHALLMRDLELRNATDGHVALLPDAPVVVLDEAHHLEEAATNAFGAELTAGRWTRIRSRIERLTVEHKTVKATAELGEYQVTAEQLAKLARQAETEAEGWFNRLAGRLAQAKALRLGDEQEAGGLLKATIELQRIVQDATPDWLSGDERESWKRLGRQLESVAMWLAAAMSPSEHGHKLVRFAEAAGNGKSTHVVVKVKPIEVSQELRERLWSRFTVVATSATLATQGDFHFWQSRVGADQPRTVVVASPFDYGRNALLYLPANGAAFDPSLGRQEGSLEYLERLVGEIEQLLLASDGRAFVLFTSYRTMRAVHDRLKPRLRWTTMMQGDLPRPELVKRFKEDGHAVLFGTRSFWEGVDVTGDALSLVVIDKLPFNVPDDPIWEARCEAVNRRQGDQWAWFNELAVPTVTIALKQGFGRLIRTKSDRGVVAILDGRLTTRPYGRRIVGSLPPATVTRSLEAVRAFFGS